MDTVMKRTMYLGEFEVVEITATSVVVLLGKGVQIHVPTQFLPNHSTKIGDKLPLYTELPYAKPAG